MLKPGSCAPMNYLKAIRSTCQAHTYKKMLASTYTRHRLIDIQFTDSISLDKLASKSNNNKNAAYETEYQLKASLKQFNYFLQTCLNEK